MSTFPGLLKEIENVSIDRFDGDNLNSTVYFLSHCHRDHMVGLCRRIFTERLLKNEGIFLYCSPISKLWLTYFLGEDGNKISHKIKEIDVGSSIMIDIPGLAPGRIRTVSITALPAGHCPGSVMFLFKMNGMNILYTGDIRMQDKDLKEMNALKDISLDSLYLDTTFASPAYKYFPTRDQSMKRLEEFCKNWLDQHEDNVVEVLRSAKIGIECVYIALHSKFGMCVHVSEEDWKQHARIRELARAITRDANKTRIHACEFSTDKNCSFLNNMNSTRKKEHVRRVKLCALNARNLRPSDDILSYYPDQKLYKLAYSSHCSQSELQGIISLLSPNKVIPCVLPDDESEDTVLGWLLPRTSEVTSSFESTIDLSPLGKSDCDDQSVKHCSQSSVNSFSSIENTPTKPEVPCNVSSHRYSVKDSSDDETIVTSPCLKKSNGLSEDDGEDTTWTNALQTKKLRVE